MLKNLKFQMAYDGTAYHGFQQQKNAITIEQILKEAVFSLTGEQVGITGCGRTDAGVHALNYTFNFKTASTIPPHRFPLAFRSCLPEDISVFSCEEVPLSFHSRFDAVKKTYRYKIHNGTVRDPFLRTYAAFYPIPLRCSLMEEAGQVLVGTHDFAAFMAQGSPVSSTIRTIYDLKVTRIGELIEIEVTGNGFLYNMVRIIVGTLIMAGNGKIQPEEMKRILASCERKEAGMTVPPWGLYLKEVCYD